MREGIVLRILEVGFIFSFSFVKTCNIIQHLNKVNEKRKMIWGRMRGHNQSGKTIALPCHYTITRMLIEFLLAFAFFLLSII